MADKRIQITASCFFRAILCAIWITARNINRKAERNEVTYLVHASVERINKKISNLF